MSREYAELVDSFEAKKIVCPLPIPWNKLVIFLKSTKQLKMYPVERGPSVHVVNPLILAGWGASDLAKWKRFKLHLKEADNMGVLCLAEEFLDKLESKDFLWSEGSLSDVSAWDIEKISIKAVEKVQAEALPWIETVLRLNLEDRYHYDPERLYEIFKSHGFFGGYEPSVSDAKNLATVEALRNANKIYNKQADMVDGAKELEDFCDALLNLKIRLRR